MSTTIRHAEIDESSPARLCRGIRQMRRKEPALREEAVAALKRSLLREKFADRQRAFFAGGQAGEEVTGQVVARLSPSLKCPAGRPLGMLGFFNARNRPEFVRPLLQRAGDWLRDQGAASVVGPLDGDTWHSWRLNLGPRTEPPFLMEPVNPPWYAALWHSAGFQAIATFHSRVIDDVAQVARLTQSSLATATEKGYRFRSLEIKDFEGELQRIYRISCAGFTDNFLYEEISEAEFVEMYRPLRAVADPRLIRFAEDRDGNLVGFLFAVVDFWRAVQAMGHRSGPWARAKFWLNRRHARAVNFKSIAVLPDHRRSSVAGALINLGYQATRDAGFQRANLCLIRDGNLSERLDGGTSRILRRYALYQSPGSRFEPVELR